MGSQLLDSPAPPPLQPAGASPASAEQPGPVAGGRARALVEVCLVFLIALGPAVVGALRDLVRGVNGWPVPASPALTPFPAYWPNQLYSLAYWSILSVPAVLALFLLLQAGARPRDLGLWRPRWRDLLGAVVLLVSAGVVSLLGSLLLHVFSDQGVFHGVGLSGSSAFDMALRSLNAGVLEETVVLGYLVTRLEGAGVSTPKAAAVSVGARTAYHLYYGSAVIIPFMFGVVFTLYFVRFRRLLPVVAAHAAWDTLLSVPHAL